MIKVECVSCKAPYELDPRRIPDKGMKMRCPKCGTSFMVSKQGLASAIAAGDAAAPAAAKPIAPPLAPPPAIGAPAPVAARAPIAPPISTAIAPPVAAGVAPMSKNTVLGHRPPDAAPAPMQMPKLKTAVGVAPPAATPPAGALVPPSGAGPAAAAAVKQAIAPAFAPPPAAAPAAASTGNRSAAAKGAFGATMMGVSAVARPQPVVEPEPLTEEEPLGFSEEPLSAAVDLPADLPAPKPSNDIQDLSVSRIYVDDLPAPKGEVDLPAPRAQAPVKPIAPPVQQPPVQAQPSSPLQFGDLDLPAPKPVAAKPAANRAPTFGDLDLPAPKVSGADLPAPKPAAADLPALKGVTDLPGTKTVADLPTPKGVADLPTPKGIADLPTAKGMADLPQARGIADLPTRKGEENLPSPKAGGTNFGDIDLPAPKVAGGFDDLDLPPPSDTLVTPRGGADESSFADLDLDLPDLPLGATDPPKGGDGFGDIELPPPKPASGLIPPKSKTAVGMGPRKVADEASFSDIELDDDNQHDSELPPSLMGGDDESSFSGLGDEPSIPSARAPRPPRPPSQDIEELEPDAEEEVDELGEGDLEGGDDFGEEEFAGGDEEDDLEDAEPGSDEEMEFGISGDEAKGLSLPPEVLRKQRGEEFEAKQAALGKRTLKIVLRIAALLVLVIGGGAALNFTEYGLFGIYYWERWLPEAGDAEFARSAIEKAEKLSSKDTYADVKRGLKELGEARRNAGLNRELLTRSLVHEALFIVRFGDDPQASAQVAAIMKRLEERSFKAPGMDLARAADAARRKQWAEMDAPLEQARAQAASDPYVELLSGEAALATGKLEVAEKAFSKALQHGAGARAQWGLARVALARPDAEAQMAAVDETLKLSPMHVEARQAEARILWGQGKEERALHMLRVALGLEPTEEDQYLWTSKPAIANGYSLLGYIHETRGRLHNARESYEAALAADPYRVDALLGSGRVLLREKRYNDAQARFESALSAATKGENLTVLSGRKADAEAKLGIGRALLGLNSGADAKAKLTELSTQLPNDAEVVLALGETENVLGNAEGAETFYRKSIDLAPQKFDGYLALSQLFFKKGDAGKASEVLNEAASKVEETAEMRRMLGQSELARNKLESAIHEYRRALELDPHDTDAMFGMSIALRKHGELPEAGKTLDEIAKRDPGFAGLAEQRGLLFEAQGEFAKAVDAYRTALEKDPGDSGLLLRLGAAQVSAADYDTAEQTLAKVIREMPNSAEAEFFIGRIAFARGRTPDALTHFDRAVSLDGTRGEFHLYVARASFEMGNLGRTLEEVAIAINFDPNLGDAYWVRAMVKLRMGAVKDALADLTKTFKLNPSRIEAYAVQGDCYEQLRLLPEAIRAYHTALEHDPSRGEWWYRQATLEADSGQRGEADGHVKRAIELGDKLETMPYWLPDAFRMAGEYAEARGDRTAAIRLFKRYVQIAAPNAIDRTEIEKKLKGWGVALEEEEQQ